MPHSWDQVGVDLRLGNVDPKPELAGGGEALLKTGGAGDVRDVLRGLWRRALWARISGNLDELRTWAKTGTA